MNQDNTLPNNIIPIRPNEVESLQIEVQRLQLQCEHLVTIINSQSRTLELLVVAGILTREQVIVARELADGVKASK